MVCVSAVPQKHQKSSTTAPAGRSTKHATVQSELTEREFNWKRWVGARYCDDDPGG
jgi:hypothetical protein